MVRYFTWEAGPPCAKLVFQRSHCHLNLVFTHGFVAVRVFDYEDMVHVVDDPYDLNKI